MPRHRPSSRSKATAALVFTAALVLLLAGDRPARSTDIDLLRFTTAKPYVFLMLDTSASMSLSPANEWVHAGADDPRSKLYQAKRVVYEVFENVEDVHFGFASMNQDNLAVRNKHWLYYTTSSPSGSWPIDWPRPDADGPLKADAEGNPVSDLQGDLITFGAHLDATGVAGSCGAPLSLATEREKINRWAKLGGTGSSTTTIWIRAGGKTYALAVSRPGNKPDSSLNPKLGENGMNVRLELSEYDAACSTVVQKFTGNQDLTLWTDFILSDEPNGAIAPETSHNNGVDRLAGWWDYRAINDPSSCGSGHPFSGKGWEGNYDGPADGSVPASALLSIDPTVDPYCVGAACQNLMRPTTYDFTYGRPLDKGDMLPMHWSANQKSELLERLAPNPGNFGVASYFQNQPDATLGVLPLVSTARKPLLASGPSPLGKSVVDFRCWYQGSGNKCSDTAFGSGGWEDVAQARDSTWGCRRPYMIVISDGQDSCKGENPCADTASLNSHSAVRTWVIAFGADCSKIGNPLSCMARNGKGELLCPQTASELKEEIQRILGIIREESRAFASAAVPSVQANVDDKIFLTNFTPLNGKSVWDGHIHAFIKPLPVDPVTGRPDTGHDNHKWDAGEEMLKHQINASDPLGSAAGQRRVYYAREGTGDELLASNRRLLEGTTDETDDAIRHDLWRGFDISFVDEDSSETAAQTRANAIIATTFAAKTHTYTLVDPTTGQPTTNTVDYILGDIFHSNPLVMGSPPNLNAFANNYKDYRDFYLKHELRRKMLIVGSNDGMLHAFDAGIYVPSDEKFDDGSGKELFAYVPRALLPTVKKLAEGTSHQWGVDGSVAVADVFIDPIHAGTPMDAEREWRTVAFGGLREGGAAYYALDITQPDLLANVGDTQNVPQPVNGYVPSCHGGDDGTQPSGCGPVPFPAVLWEFEDQVRDDSNELVFLDENTDDLPDLGFTWSVPNVGRIKVNDGTGTVDKFVLVVGGGFDPDRPTRGNFLYMIDAETGKAIYKRELDGAVPSEPAAVDTDQDGYLDRIYVGTTEGWMYRVDLTADSSGNYPSLTTVKALGLDDVLHDVPRIDPALWKPYKIFNANTDAGTAVAPARQIFFRPSVFLVSRLGEYALAFGTGDRNDLWSTSGRTGRFYVFVDDSASLALANNTDDTLVPTEAALTEIQIGDANLEDNPNLLTDQPAGSRGWYVVLNAEERLITESFALTGITFFSTYRPVVTVLGSSRDPQCAKSGTSQIYVLSTTNGNAFMKDASGLLTRHLTVASYVTSPFTEQGLTRNPNNLSGTGSGSDPTVDNEKVCDPETQQALTDSLKSLFPPTCRFGNGTVDIQTIADDTSLLCIAQVPVCTITKNWKDH
jgi:hypothetical protein